MIVEIDNPALFSVLGFDQELVRIAKKYLRCTGTVTLQCTLCAGLPDDKFSDVNVVDFVLRHLCSEHKMSALGLEKYLDVSVPPTRLHSPSDRPARVNNNQHIAADLQVHLQRMGPCSADQTDHNQANSHVFDQQSPLEADQQSQMNSQSFSQQAQLYSDQADNQIFYQRTVNDHAASRAPFQQAPPVDNRSDSRTACQQTQHVNERCDKQASLQQRRHVNDRSDSQVYFQQSEPARNQPDYRSSFQPARDQHDSRVSFQQTRPVNDQPDCREFKKQPSDHLSSTTRKSPQEAHTEGHSYSLRQALMTPAQPADAKNNANTNAHVSSERSSSTLAAGDVKASAVAQHPTRPLSGAGAATDCGTVSSSNNADGSSSTGVQGSGSNKHRKALHSDMQKLLNKNDRVSKRSLEEKKMLTCAYCKVVFDSVSDVFSHYDSVHDDGFTTRMRITNKNLRRRVEPADNDDVAASGHLPTSDVTAQGRVQASELRECSHCPMCYTIIKSGDYVRHVLLVHYWSRLSKRAADHGLYTCSQCGKEFTFRRNLQLHQKFVHEGVKRRSPSERGKTLTCGICGYTTPEARRLEAHQQAMHMGLAPYKCKHCDFTTRERTSLRDHTYRHFNQKPYSCNYCAYACIHRYAMKSHLRKAHSIELPAFPRSRATPEARRRHDAVDEEQQRHVTINRIKGLAIAADHHYFGLPLNDKDVTQRLKQCNTDKFSHSGAKKAKKAPSAAVAPSVAVSAAEQAHVVCSDSVVYVGQSTSVQGENVAIACMQTGSASHSLAPSRADDGVNVATARPYDGVNVATSRPYHSVNMPPSRLDVDMNVAPSRPVGGANEATSRPDVAMNVMTSRPDGGVSPDSALLAQLDSALPDPEALLSATFESFMNNLPQATEDESFVGCMSSTSAVNMGGIQRLDMNADTSVTTLVGEADTSITSLNQRHHGSCSW